MPVLPSQTRAGPRSPWTAPVLAGATVAAATAVVALVSPEQPGTYPVCPFHAVTGWWCPGCGSLRAVHALATGDVATAVERNVLLVLAAPVLVVAWAWWLRRTITGRSRRPPADVSTGRRAAWVVVATVGTFWVLRNLPAGSWLAP